METKAALSRKGKQTTKRTLLRFGQFYWTQSNLGGLVSWSVYALGWSVGQLVSLVSLLSGLVRFSEIKGKGALRKQTTFTSPFVKFFDVPPN